jgi:hypothetical protein
VHAHIDGKIKIFFSSLLLSFGSNKNQKILLNSNKRNGETKSIYRSNALQVNLDADSENNNLNN